ncbi:uncharacterized protein KZ484_023355 [Pholidichthys leucotaenia]
MWLRRLNPCCSKTGGVLSPPHHRRRRERIRVSSKTDYSGAVTRIHATQTGPSWFLEQWINASLVTEESVFTFEESASLSLNPPDTPASVAAPASDPTPEPAPSPAPSTSGTTHTSVGKRKRSHSTEDLATLFARMQADEVRQHDQRERQLDQRDRHIHLILNDARESREQEAILRREEMAQTAAFNQAFLGVLGDLVKVMSDQCV